ncbi:hypothetical protein [Xylophilus ampelinus]|uniref:Uncharacterized protein n=1 Tax=Xylophilus ampelinus TaxID=54067 RepID=A0A318SNI0_9BURK|nr:hypothetical protein [Xylophilus ampelinus]MCS4509723.1 hypothetical protein [Xylophilus ampelinus]PYE78749.1 hypothetical protein DFQ15_105108 [Xylophilus ampelinus]
MTTPIRIKRIENLVWILIYGGLFSMLAGAIAHDSYGTTGKTLVVLGGIAAAAGVVLIYVRSKMGD